MWVTILVLHLPDAATSTSASFQDAQPSASVLQPAIDPIDATYVAISPAKVREKPDVLSTRVKTIDVGQKINVVGT